MNRLVIIGNGFDMAHGLKTSYMDFINWYWKQRLDALLIERSPISEDCLCRLELRFNSNYTNWYSFFFNNCSLRNSIDGKWKKPPYDVIKGFEGDHNDFSVTFSPFLKRIMESYETKRWVDIENDYYELLKECTENSKGGYKAKVLNEHLSFLKDRLVDYLRTLGIPNKIGEIETAIKETLITINNLSTEGKELAKKIDNSINIDYNSFDENRYTSEHFQGLEPEHTMLLCFNYTETVREYELLGGTIVNYIHGKLDHPEHIIFGYGDELDKDYPNIRDKNDNELLKNVKSVKYLETSNYRRMLDFIDSAPFQVLIMGHSCGNSDRTLLNTVFEHENCVSIKPYYHQWANGSDNYLDIVQNISRHFTDMRLYRNRVVNKEQCQTM